MNVSPPASAPDAAAHLARKAAALDARLAGLGSVIVAYSGGVDSALVAVAATRILGSRALCITAGSPSYPERHRDLAIGVARVGRGRRLHLVPLREQSRARPRPGLEPR